MKYVDGQSLAARIKDRPLEFRDAAAILLQISNAVHHAHQCGVLHRDLKPSNILIDKQGTPLVADFGLAKIIESESDTTRSGEFVGTPNYMSPEQARGEKEQTIRVDIYALGAIMYELLTGRPPHTGTSLADTLKNILDAVPAPPRTLNSKIPIDLSTICMKCLEKAPADRYKSASELSADLDNWLRNRPIVARRKSIALRTVKWMQRHPSWTALIGLAFLSGLALWWSNAVSSFKTDQQEARALLLFASTSLETHDREKAKSELAKIPKNLRGWEWRYLQRLTYYSPSNRIELEGFIPKLAVVPGTNECVSVTNSGKLDRWNTKTLSHIQTLQLPAPDRFSDFDFNLTATQVAYRVAGQNTRVDIFDVAKGELIQSVASHNQLPSEFLKKIPLYTNIFSSDGRWRVEPQFNLKVFDTSEKPERMVWGDISGEKALFTPNSKSLVVLRTFSPSTYGTQAIDPILPQDRQYRTQWKFSRADNGQTEEILHGSFVTEDFDFLDSGERIIACDHVYEITPQEVRPPSGISIYDLEGKPTSRILRASKELLNKLSISSDGQFVAAGCADGHAYVWRIATGEMIGDIPCYKKDRIPSFHPSMVFLRLETPSVAFSTVGNFLAVDQQVEPKDGGMIPGISLYEVPSLNKKWTTRPGQSNINAGMLWYSQLIWIKPNELLAFDRTGMGFYASAHSFESGNTVLPAELDALGRALSERIKYPDEEFHGFAATPDKSVLAAYRWFEIGSMALVAIDAKSHNVKFGFGEDAGREIGVPSLNNSGTQLALTQGSSILLLRTSDGHELHRLKGSSSKVISLAFHPDGSRLAAGCVDGTINLYDTQTGTEMFTLRGHTSSVLDCSFTPDGLRLLSSSADGTVRIWESILPGDFAP